MLQQTYWLDEYLIKLNKNYETICSLHGDIQLEGT